MNCNLCGSSVDKFVRSHVIPQAIHEISKQNTEPTTAKIISSRSGEYPKKSPTGVYDKFVCQECERLFQEWDDCALDFFRGVYKLSFSEKSQHVLCKNINYAKLKLFFLSLLWRADASKNQSMYEVVDIGDRHRRTLVKMLMGLNPGSWNEYSVTLERFKTDRSAASIIRSPRKSKIGDVLFYTFYLAGFKAHIQCDSRKIPENLEGFFLSEDKPLLVPLVSFEESPEYLEYLKVVSMPHNENAF